MIDGEKEKGVQDLGLCTPFFIRSLGSPAKVCGCA